MAAWHFRKPRSFSFEDLKLTILPTVFHPGIYLSTGILVEFLSTIDLKGKTFLELGAGNGLTSFVAAKKGAIVTATDINTKAIEGIQENAKKNKLSVKSIASDLFEKVHPDDFDIIIINPPYYPKNPSSTTEMAFYCGEDFSYFNRLFKQVNEQLSNSFTEIFMILSEDCELEKIKEIAKSENIHLFIVHEEKKMQEQNYIFKFVRHE